MEFRLFGFYFYTSSPDDYLVNHAKSSWADVELQWNQIYLSSIYLVWLMADQMVVSLKVIHDQINTNQVHTGSKLESIC